jgi:hypothetical protein
MIDEAYKLKDVTDGAAIAHWLNAFRLLADRGTKEVGVLVSASHADVEEMADALKDVQVRSRFGEGHYIFLHALGPEETTEFLHGLLSEWIDPTKRKERVAAYHGETDGESIHDTIFPFTQRAFDRFVEYATRNGGVTNPRDIQNDLDAILNQAIDAERHIISRKYLDRLFAQG